MRRKVYRSLDKPSEFFGIKGRFMLILLLFAGLCAVISIIIGQVFGMIIGIGAGILSVVVAYLCVLTIQSKIKEKDLFKMLNRMSYPTVYSFRPKHIRNIWRGFNLQSESLNE